MDPGEIVRKLKSDSTYESYQEALRFVSSNGGDPLIEAGIFPILFCGCETTVELIEMKRELAGKLFANAKFDLAKHEPEVVQALIASYDLMKECLLDQLIRHIEKDPGSLKHFVSNTLAMDILLAAVTLVACDNLGVYKRAAELIKTVCRLPAGPKLLFSNTPSVTQLHELAITVASSVVRFRLHELTGELCCISTECINYCAQTGLIKAWIDELNNNEDVLAQLTTLESLADVCCKSPLVVSYFRDTQVLQTLHNLLAATRDGCDNFLFPGIIKFFGYLSTVRPQECDDQYPEFLRSVFHLVSIFDHLDVGQRLLAFDTLGVFASTAEGKKVLEGHVGAMDHCLKCFGQAISNGPTEVRMRHLQALVNIISLEPENRQNNQLVSLTERWMKALSDRPGDLLFKIFQQPILELKCAAGEVILKAVEQPWGQKLMARVAGFPEHLLNRETEFTMSGRYVKYDIIKAMLDSGTASEAFDAGTIELFQQYCRQGPYFVTAEPHQVAFGES